MPYRLLALDLDGTTVVDGGPPSSRVRAAIVAAADRGVHVIVATGRPYVSARRFAAALDLCTPVICFQGALVKECGGPEGTLYAESVPSAPLVEVAAYSERRGLELNIYTEDRIYHGPTDHAADFYERWFGMEAQQVDSLVKITHTLGQQGRPVLKGLYIGEPGANDQLMIDLTQQVSDRLSVIRSHPFFVEVTSPQASKGNALAFVADWYGIPRSETIAAGDSGNDVSMVAWAGLGVAMGNASADVLAVADWVAPPVTEDGIAALIEQFIL